MDLVTDFCRFVGVPTPSPERLTLILTTVGMVLTVPFLFLFHFSSRPRTQKIPIYRERVLILGASTERGVGEALALHYAERGCRDLVLVARNLQGLEQVKQKCIVAAAKGEEWTQADEAPGDETKQGAARFHTFAADCTDPHDVDRLRKYLLANLKGLDTLHVCFGVSALLPLLGIADVDPIRPPKAGFTTIHPNEAGLKAVSEAVTRASHVNLTGTAVCLAALTPMLQTTSPFPAIALTSSAAALFPAPTRSLYAATKAAQLALFRSFAIECTAHAEASRNEPSGEKRRSKIHFLAVCPGTISSSFRKSAVDLVAENQDDLPQDRAWKAGEKMLSAETVANDTVFAVDRYKSGTLTMPKLYAAATWIEKIYPSYVERVARKKYGY